MVIKSTSILIRSSVTIDVVATRKGCGAQAQPVVGFLFHRITTKYIKESTVSEKNATKVNQLQTTPSNNVKLVVALSLFFIQPLGAVLWFKYFKRPNAAVKTIVSIIWFFVWLVFVGGVIAAITDYDPRSAKAGDNSGTQAVQRESVARIGQVVSDGGFDFTVNSIKCGETRIKTKGDVYFYSDAQGQFCRLNVTITNTGDSVNSIDASSQYVYNSKDQQYSYDSSATSSAANYSLGNPLNDDINPGNSITGDFVFDVPEGTKLTEAELHANDGTRGVRIRLK